MDVDDIIDQVDAGACTASKHSVVRFLCAFLPRLEDEDRALLAIVDSGETPDLEHWAKRLWSRIDPLPYEQQGGLRMLVGLIHPDKPMDWHDAGYLIDWAKQQAIPDAAIVAACGFTH